MISLFLRRRVVAFIVLRARRKFDLWDGPSTEARGLRDG